MHTQQIDTYSFVHSFFLYIKRRAAAVRTHKGVLKERKFIERRRVQDIETFIINEKKGNF